jgi:hypothetical protein
LKTLASEASASTADRESDWAQVEPLERGNLWFLALHQIIFRVGWIFKTESIIIPAFLDTIAGAGWLRGFLPVLTRLGQGLPPVFGTRLLRRTTRKKDALAWLVLLMALPYALLAVLWGCVGGAPPRWMPAAFLVLYLAFFVTYGFYQLAFGAVQGKLIRPTRRGWLMLVATFGGLVPAMAAAWWLLDDWLQRPAAGFAWIFGFVAVAFCCSLCGVLALREPADVCPAPLAPGSSLADVAHTLADDQTLRRLVLVAMLFASGLIVMPHYEALARQLLGLEGRHLLLWVLTQNASVSLLSLVVGPLADARGYRLTLRLLVFGSAVGPLYAVALTCLPAAVATRIFWLVFIPLGISPLLVVTLMNYALEICQPVEHPLYLSAVNLCLMVPFLFAPLVGWFVDAFGFRTVLLVTAALIVASGLLTFTLDEPRRSPDRTDEQRPADQG